MKPVFAVLCNWVWRDARPRQAAGNDRSAAGGGRRLPLLACLVLASLSFGCGKTAYKVALSPELARYASTVRMELGGRLAGSFTPATRSVEVRMRKGDPRDAAGLPQFTLDVETPCGWRNGLPAETLKTSKHYEVGVSWQYETQAMAHTRRDLAGDGPGLFDIHLYFDNRGGGALPIRVGQLTLQLPANTAGDLWFPMFGCTAGAAVSLGNVRAGTIPYDDPDAETVFVGTRKNRCYRLRQLVYSQNGGEPSMPPQTLLGQSVYPLGTRQLAYFFKAPPASKMAPSSFVAKALTDDKCPK